MLLSFIKESKMIRLLIILLVIVFCFSGVTFNSYANDAEEIMSDENDSIDNSEKSYIVVTKNRKSSDKIKARIEQKYELSENNSIELEDKNIILAEMTEEEANKLSKDSSIIIIEEDILLTAETTLDDESLEDPIGYDILEESEQSAPEEYGWNVQMINSTEDEIGTPTESGIKIAIIDSGVAISPELPIIERVDIAGSSNEALTVDDDDITGHGTAIAGIIGAKKDDEGIIGVNPNAEMYSVRVLDENNQAPLSRILEGIYWAIDNDMNIINMSFGTSTNSQALHEAIMEAYDSNILLVAASGNEGTESAIEYPAAFPEVIAVGSVNSQGEKSTFSSGGNDAEIFSPGEAIISNGLFWGYAGVEGTSMACPHVAAAASIIWALDDSKSNDYIRQLLVASAKKIESEGGGSYNLLDVGNAIEQRDAFDVVYVPGQIEYPEIEENEEDVSSYDTEGIVAGSWGGSSHSSLVTTAPGISGVSTNYVNLMKEVSVQADNEDTWPGCMKRVRALHGYGNYLANAKYIYRVARKIKTSSTTLYGSTSTLFDGISITGMSSGDNASNIMTGNLADIQSAVRACLNKSFLSGVDETPNAAKAWKLMGLVTHILGDTYAHVSRVPIASIADGNFNNADFGGVSHTSSHKPESSTAAAMMKNITISTVSDSFNKNCLTCFQKVVQKGWMEFRDIKYFRRSTSSTSYEDNTSFYSTRYNVASKHAVNTAITRIKADNDFATATFLPPSGHSVKLNNLRNNIQNGVASSTWAEYLTDTALMAKIDDLSTNGKI